MKKINLIQFIPYFPPHKWWLENVSEELACFYSKGNYWDVINVTSDIWQNKSILHKPIFSKDKIVYYYETAGYKVYLIPSFNLISNFPVPKFWTKEFFIVFKELKKLIKEKSWDYVIQTHTRFFLSSLFWWIFAKIYNLKWTHVEHGSDYVKLSSQFKSKLSYFYDKIFWKWIFKNCDKIVTISSWVQKFIEKEFNIYDKFELIYNWINFKYYEKVDNWDTINIWFVWRLVKLKWVDLLINSFFELSKKYSNINLKIIWDWDEKENLMELTKKLWVKNIEFLWFKDREYIWKEFLPKIDILVNPSYQEWLPTSVIEWLLSSCVVVATDVWWTREISEFDDLIIVDNWNIESLTNWIEKGILSYEDIVWKSREYVICKFDWKKNIEKYFSLYNNF